MDSIHSILCEAADRLGSGNLQSSFELNLKALLAVITELQKITFHHNYCLYSGVDISSAFVIAKTCLQNAEDIAHRTRPICSPEKVLVEEPAEIKNPPPLPPKPKTIHQKHSANKAPPLPVRPKQPSNEPIRPRYQKPAPLLRLRSLQPSAITTSVSDDDLGSDDDEDDEDFDLDLDEEYDDIAVYKEKDPRTRPRIQTYRRSSTSNIPIPPSPLSANPLTAVKTFLSLPGSMSSHSDGSKKTTGLVAPPMSSESSRTAHEYDEILMLTQDAIDPGKLVHVQTSSGDSLGQPNAGHPARVVPAIPQAPLSSVYKALQKKLDDLESSLRELKLKAKPKDPDNNRPHQLAMTIADAKSTLNRVHSIHISATAVPTILQFPPVLIAYQLTLIDSAIFRNIPSTALLCHSAKTPHSAIVASTDFFNYLTRVIEHAILLQQEASGRAQHVNHWIKVACKCHDLKNYQTLKAIISALGTPPIQRLKRTWAFVPKKSLSRLETLTELMSEASNYGRYRERLGPIHEQTSSSSTPTTSVLTKKDWLSEPTVPFLGIFIHDMTYLIALQKSKRSTEETKPLGSIKPPMPQQYNRQTKPVVLSSPSDQRVNELMGLFEYYQKRPLYSATLSPACVKDLYKSRRRKLSHALRGGPSMKKHPVFSTADDEAGEVCTEMQQCLVTQYLLTRSWVGEKTVDELSLLREPPKTTRSNSTIDCMASNNSSISLLPSQINTSLCPPGPSWVNQEGLRNSSGSLSLGQSSGDSSGDSRPISMEDQQDGIDPYDVAGSAMGLPGAGIQKLLGPLDEGRQEKKEPKSGFWLFGRKSAEPLVANAMTTKAPDAGSPYLQIGSEGGLQRSPRHFSLDGIEDTAPPSPTSTSTGQSNTLKKRDRPIGASHREGSFSSQPSLTTIFRKEFWKTSYTTLPKPSDDSEPAQSSESQLSPVAAKRLGNVSTQRQQPACSTSHKTSPDEFADELEISNKAALFRRRSSSSLNKNKKSFGKSELGRHTVGRSPAPKQHPAMPVFSTSPHPLDALAVGVPPLPINPPNTAPLVFKRPTRTYERHTSETSSYHPLHDIPVAFKTA